MPSKNFAIGVEIDGLRFVSSKKNEILRRLPDSFVNIFLSLSTKPSAMLYSGYESFEANQPIEDEDFK